jgi:hypothetical protein
MKFVSVGAPFKRRERVNVPCKQLRPHDAALPALYLRTGQIHVVKEGLESDYLGAGHFLGRAA